VAEVYFSVATLPCLFRKVEYGELDAKSGVVVHIFCLGDEVVPSIEDLTSFGIDLFASS
jgi:hypothetical protein